MLSRIILGVALAGSVVAALAFAPAAAPSAPVAAADFRVDGVHSFVIFRCKHNNAAYAYGMFHKTSGSLTFDESSPESGSLSITVATDSVSTGNSKRDDHLKSADFFSAAEFPIATFKSKSFKKTGENTYDVTGDFTLRGTTREITVKLDKTGQSKDRSGKDILGFETTFTINRMDYGVKYGPGALGDEVRITVSLEVGKS